MRYIGRKLPTGTLCILRLGHIEGEDHQTVDSVLILNAAEYELIFPSVSLGSELMPPICKGCIHGIGHILPPIHGAEVTPDAALIRAEQFLCRRIDTQHRAVLIQQHQSFPHMGDDLSKLTGFALQLPHLRPDLAVLMMDTVQYGRKLIIRIVLHRVFQVKFIERLRDFPCHTAGEDGGENDSEDRHNAHRLDHAHNKHQKRLTADGDTQHCTVGQAAGSIDGALQQCIGMPRGTAGAAVQRFNDLLTVCMVFHCCRIRVSIVEHSAV